MLKHHGVVKTLSALVLLGITGLEAINQGISLKTRKWEQRSGKKNSSFYAWKSGNIYYRKTGEGMPVLLIHDAQADLCSDEWLLTISLLSKSCTVYVADLPGCGRSNMPPVTYTNYFYAIFIRDFIRDVIGQPCCIAASGFSGSFAVTAAQLSPEIITHLIMINPVSLKRLARGPEKTGEGIRILFSLPVIGNTLYHIYHNRTNTEYRLYEKKFYNPFRISSHIRSASYINSHRNKSGGRYFLGCYLGRYLNWDIRRGLRIISQPVTIIYSETIKGQDQIAIEYRRIHKETRLYSVSDSGIFPQIEQPKEFAEIVMNTVCSDQS